MDKKNQINFAHRTTGDVNTTQAHTHTDTLLQYCTKEYGHYTARQHYTEDVTSRDSLIVVSLRRQWGFSWRRKPPPQNKIII